ncbi:hypothetical protein JWG45_12405 [Leptospira sp. 201903070]|uniref:DUF1564 family protein n=1 Tax=Leptospira ainlahdjerensis TaxID=2810033 RepID=A0ABS2UC42_9LEPT|nr:hypothetical protein [Leptospira ainlahdjerensis]MBM9577949.1 hypothetical protein [Leptospira ainlahdjerensis]
MTKKDSKEFLRLLKEIPNLFLESKKLAEKNPIPDPYPYLENLTKEFRKAKKSYQIGIPYRHFTTCSSKEHRFVEVKYEVFIFTKGKESKFSILESRLHEIDKHQGGLLEEEEEILHDFNP